MYSSLRRTQFCFIRYKIVMPIKLEARTTLPSNNKAYAKKEYWEERFATEESFEWLVSYDDIAIKLEKYLPRDKADPM